MKRSNVKRENRNTKNWKHKKRNWTRRTDGNKKHNSNTDFPKTHWTRRLTPISSIKENYRSRFLLVESVTAVGISTGDSILRYWPQMQLTTYRRCISSVTAECCLTTCIWPWNTGSINTLISRVAWIPCKVNYVRGVVFEIIEITQVTSL